MRDVVEEFKTYLDALPEGTVYTGVGSRDTPRPIGVLMCAFALEMRVRGFRLRSGAADGADLSFESGAHPLKEIFLPFPKFNGSDSPMVPIHDRCYEMAGQVHPAWDRCQGFAAHAHARNVYQVHGKTLDTPTEFLVCWTADGAVNAETAVSAGGTRTAIVLAHEADILVLNMGLPAHLELIEAVISDECRELANRHVRMKGSRAGVFFLPEIALSEAKIPFFPSRPKL